MEQILLNRSLSEKITDKYMMNTYRIYKYQYQMNDLMIACMFEAMPDVIEILQDNSIDINAKDIHGRTALCICCMYQLSIEIIQLLLSQPGININESDSDHGNSAIMYATMFGNIEIVTLLLQQPNIILTNINDHEQNVKDIAEWQNHLEVKELINNYLINNYLIQYITQ